MQKPKPYLHYNYSISIRKASFIILIMMCAIMSQAQVKIGNNPSSIDSSSMLEMESDTLGLLIPRVALNDLATPSPLKYTVPEGMLIYNSTGTEAKGFYYWDGSKYVLINTTSNAKKRDNFVLIKSASDFPAAVGGVITLAAGVMYEINGTITLTDKINLNGSYVVGLDANNDILAYTPNTGSLFTGNNGGTIKNLTLTAPTSGAKVFDIEDLVGSKNLIVRGCIIANSDNIGLIKGFYIVFFDVINFSGNKNGITYENIKHLLLGNQAWFESNSGTFETYVGTFKLIEKLGGFADSRLANSATAIDVSGITSISNGELKNGTFTGDGIRIAGSFTKQWEVDAAGINIEKDDVASGDIYISTSVTTSITASQTPIKAAGTTSTSHLFRFTSPVNNRLTYGGTKTRTFNVSASFSMSASGNNNIYLFYIAKNGVLLSETQQRRKIANGGDVGALTITGLVELAPTDYIEIWVENNTNGQNLTLENMNLSIR